MKRLWGIRHVRWLWHAWRFSHWWEHTGRYLWLTPNTADVEFLERIWEGKA